MSISGKKLVSRLFKGILVTKKFIKARYIFFVKQLILNTRLLILDRIGL